MYLRTAKKSLFLLAFLLAGHFCFGQARGENYFAQKWLFDVNFPVGLAYQQANSGYTPNFQFPLNSQFQNFKLSPAANAGIDFEFGYFLGKKKLFGFGTGFEYIQSISHISLDNYHIEYETTDNKKQVYRQVVSSNGQIFENLNNNSINVPIVFKFKQVFSKRIGFSVDAGLLLNVKNSTNYTAFSGFNYEAIYAYNSNGADQYTHVYDNSPTPNLTDWLITVKQYQSHNPGGSVESYFDSLQSRGYKVGLNMNPSNPKGTINRPGSALGVIFRPAINIRIYQRLYLYFGGYVSYQVFNTTVSQKYRLIDNYGTTYSSLLGTISSMHVMGLGGNIGARVFLGRSNIYQPHKED